MPGILQPFLGFGSISNPNQITGLQLWYDATVANSTNFDPVPTNGGTVQRWVDKLGNGRNADQSVNSKKPLWFANQQGGQGAMLFDGTADVLTLNPIGGWALSRPGVTMFIVIKAATLTGTPHISSTNTNGYKYYWNSNWGIEFAGGNAISNVPGDTTNYHIMTVVYNGTRTDADITVQNNLRLQFRYDRVPRPLTFNTNVNATTSPTATGLNIGADNSGSANYYNGYLGEMIIYTETLTQAQIDSVESFLETKWGL